MNRPPFGYLISQRTLQSIPEEARPYTEAHLNSYGALDLIFNPNIPESQRMLEALFAALVTSHPWLRKLKVSGPGMSQLFELTWPGTRSLMNALSVNTSLITLRLWGIVFEDHGLTLPEALANRREQLQELELSYNGITPTGCRALRSAFLTGNQSLRVLVLNGNQIGDAECFELARLIQGNRTIRKLGLRDVGLSGCNHPQDEERRCGVCAWSRALTINETLLELDLQCNAVRAFPVQPWLEPDHMEATLTCRVHVDGDLQYPPRHYLRTPDLFNSFLEDLRSGCTHTDTLNIAIVGHSGVGKSTLVQSVLLNESLLGDPITWSCQDVQRWCAMRSVPEPLKRTLFQLQVNGKKLLATHLMSELISAVEEEKNVPVSQVVVFCNTCVAELRKNSQSEHARGLYVPTVGVDVSQAKFRTTSHDDRHPLPIQRPERLYANILDFAGEIEYYASHQMFLGRTLSVYVVTGRVYSIDGALCEKDFCESIEHWLRFLSTLARGSVRVPVLIAATCFDLLQPPAQVCMTAFIDKNVLRWKQCFKQLEFVTNHGPQLWFPIDYSNSATTQRLREAVQARLEHMSSQHIIPSAYAAARIALDKHLGLTVAAPASGLGDHPHAAKRGSMILPVHTCHTIIRSGCDPGVFDRHSTFPLKRALEYLASTSQLFLDDRIPGYVVVRPLQWFASTVSSFIPAPRGTHNLFISTMHEALKTRPELRPGALPWDILQNQYALLGCSDEEELLRVLQFLEAIDFVHLVRSDCASSNASAAVKEVWAPTLLPSHGTMKAQLLWESYTHAAVSEDYAYVGRRLRVKSDLIIPPALYPQLLVRLQRRVCGMGAHIDARLCAWKEGETCVFAYVDDSRRTLSCIGVGPSAEQMVTAVCTRLAALTALHDESMFVYEGLCYHCLKESGLRCDGSVRLFLYECPSAACTDSSRTLSLLHGADTKCASCTAPLGLVQAPAEHKPFPDPLVCPQCCQTLHPSVLLYGAGVQEMICRDQHSPAHVFPRPSPQLQEQVDHAPDIFISCDDSMWTVARALKFLVDRAVGEEVCFLRACPGSPLHTERTGLALYGCRVGVVLLSEDYLNHSTCCRETNGLLSRLHGEEKGFTLWPVNMASEDLPRSARLSCISLLRRCERKNVDLDPFLARHVAARLLRILRPESLPDTEALAQILRQYRRVNMSD